MQTNGTNPLLEAAIEDYRKRYASGEIKADVFIRMYGERYGRPEDIVDAIALDEPIVEGSTIDVRFKDQDHVACYRVEEGKVIFQGFES
jgi:hypothetical protein